MIEDGLIDEVKELMKKYPSSLRAFQAIGYKELMSNIDSEDLSETISLIKQKTRNYAKRQYTYFNNQLPVKWFDTYEEALSYMLGRGK